MKEMLVTTVLIMAALSFIGCQRNGSVKEADGAKNADTRLAEAEKNADAYLAALKIAEIPEGAQAARQAAWLVDKLPVLLDYTKAL